MSLPACTQTAQERSISRDKTFTGSIQERKVKHFNGETAGDRIDGTNSFKKVSGKATMWIKQTFRRQT